MSASPVTLALDANSLSTTDTFVQTTGTFAKQFAVGIIITDVSTSDWIDDLYGFQFTLNFDPAKLTAQGLSPNATVQFGAMTAHNWAGFLASNNAFSVININNTAGTVVVAYTLITPATPRDITAPTILAKVNFEIDTAAPAPGTAISLSSVLLSTDKAVSITQGTSEFIIYDADSSTTFTTGDTVIVGRTVFPVFPASGASTLDDPNIKFYDTRGDGHWDPEPTEIAFDPIVYDSNSNSVYDAGEPSLFKSPPAPGTVLTDDLKIRFGPTTDAVYTFGTPLLVGGAINEIVTNSSPIASFTFTPANPVLPGPSGLTSVTFDATASSDTDGTITNYLWDFADGLGEQDLGSSPPYQIGCSAPGCSFSVTLRVVDNLGATGQARDSSGNLIVDDQPSHTSKVLIIDTPPTLDPLAPRTVDEEVILTFTATASDPDRELVIAPPTPTLGAFLKVDALITYDDTRVNDVRDPGESVVYDTNGNGVYDALEPVIAGTAPALLTPLKQDPKVKYVDSNNNNIWESGETVAYDSNDNGAYDPDPLTFSLTGAPTGASIDSATGVFTWAPTEAQGPNSYTFNVRVSDSVGVSDTEPITVTVNEVNRAPTVNPVADSSLGEETSLTLTITATDPDTPANTITFSLGTGAPSGANINPSTGVLTWTPIEAQGPAVVTFTVIATDSGSPALTASQTVTVTILEVNKPPVLTVPAAQTPTAGTQVSFTISASDPDLPANTVTFSATGLPQGATFDAATGRFSWTPGSAQTGEFTITFTATDNGNPSLTDTKTVRIMVQAPPSVISLPLVAGGVIAAIVVALLLWQFVLRKKGPTKPPTTTKSVFRPASPGKFKDRVLLARTGLRSGILRATRPA